MTDDFTRSIYSLQSYEREQGESITMKKMEKLYNEIFALIDTSGTYGDSYYGFCSLGREIDFPQIVSQETKNRLFKAYALGIRNYISPMFSVGPIEPKLGNAQIVSKEKDKETIPLGDIKHDFS